MKQLYGFEELGNITETDRKHKYYEMCFKRWRAMFQRCYDKKLHEVEETYRDCEVCKEWWTFSNFFHWFIEKYYELPNERVQIDKDLLIKGNKLYSPDTCCFLPQTINSMLTKGNKIRGKCLIGVSYIVRDRVFRAQCNNGKKQRISLGDYDCEDDAFMAYKNYKEKLIKEYALKYKNVLEDKAYKALMSYKVERID